MIMLITWVDDLIVATANKDILVATKNDLMDRVKMKDFCTISCFLGIDFKQYAHRF